MQRPPSPLKHCAGQGCRVKVEVRGRIPVVRHAPVLQQLAGSLLCRDLVLDKVLEGVAGQDSLRVHRQGGGEAKGASRHTAPSSKSNTGQGSEQVAGWVTLRVQAAGEPARFRLQNWCHCWGLTLNRKRKMAGSVRGRGEAANRLTGRRSLCSPTITEP